MKVQESIQTKLRQPEILIIHPLFDVPELKCDPSGLGQIKMSPSVRFSLVVLRGYLILMGGMLVFHMLDLAGVFGHHGAK